MLELTRRGVAGLAALAVGYYLAARLGLALRIAGTPSSAMWAGNAVLLAAALVVPARRWPLLTLAVIPAHVAAHVGGAMTPLRLVAQLVHNVALCLGAAATLGALVPRRLRFDDLREAGLFLAVAVVAAPFAAAALSPAVIEVLLGRAAGPVWVAWGGAFLSSAVPILTFTPGLVLAVVRARRPHLPRVTLRTLEAVVLAAALVASVIPGFGLAARGADPSPAVLYAPIPFLLWAAARFGVAGANATLAGLALVAAWGQFHGVGPFTERDPFENLLDVQIFLVSVAAPLLLLATLVDERRRTAVALRASEREARASYERVQDLAGRLIEAQESERSRVARELHDDVNQQVAALAIALSGVKRRLPPSASALHADVGLLQQRTGDLADAIRRVCRDLHPALLQHAGMLTAIRTLATELGRQHGVDVRFVAPEALEEPPPDAALCLYRVAQEALRNAVRHGAPSRVSVELREADGALELTVADDGRGIDLAVARRRGGLGLVSLEERVRLLGGTLSIGAGVRGGTELRARIPAGGHDGADARAARG